MWASSREAIKKNYPLPSLYAVEKENGEIALSTKASAILDVALECLSLEKKRAISLIGHSTYQQENKIDNYKFTLHTLVGYNDENQAIVYIKPFIEL